MLDQLFTLFLKEKQYMNNCTPRTIRFFQNSFNAFRKTFKGEEITKQVLVSFVVGMRERGLCPKSGSDHNTG